MLLLLLIGTAYFFGKNGQSKSETKPPVNNQSISTSPEPISTTRDPNNLAPITPDTVSYAYDETTLVLKYRNKAYLYDSTNKSIKEPVSANNYSSLKWYGLINAPVNQADSKYNGGYDEIFDMIPLGNGDFAFIMRWGQTENTKLSWKLPIYYFNNTDQKLNLVTGGSWPKEPEYSVPRFNSFSNDNEYMALNMFGCWNCGGHYPEINLVKLESKATKNLGKVIDFSWNESGSYKYRDYKEIECSEPGPGVCLDENQPLKNGIF